MLGRALKKKKKTKLLKSFVGLISNVAQGFCRTLCNQAVLRLLLPVVDLVCCVVGLVRGRVTQSVHDSVNGLIISHLDSVGDICTNRELPNLGDFLVGNEMRKTVREKQNCVAIFHLVHFQSLVRVCQPSSSYALT